MPDVDLDPARRAAVVARLQQALLATAPSATVSVRGSLGDGSGDRFSDIDLYLTVDAEHFERCLLAVPAAVERVGRLRLLRVDPETIPVDDRRLIFVLFKDLPLFWRLDLEVVATASPPQTAALTDLPWRAPASALMNAIAAIKALARRDTPTASGLLQRGFDRIGVSPPDQTLAHLVVALSDACATLDPGIADMAQETSELAQTLLGS